MSIRIIIDSTTDLPEQYISRVKIVPMTVRFGDQEYVEGKDLTKDEFYRMLRESSVLPTTSQAPPAAFEPIYKEITEDGDSAVVITVASTLSGTYQSARLAAQDFPNIRVVDSSNATVGTAVLALYALSIADTYTDLDELALHLIQQSERICLLARLDTLEYLMKGGRISKTAAIAGSLLNVKPVLAIRHGEISVLGKARGSKKANNFLNEQTASVGVDYQMPVLLGYSGPEDSLLQNYIQDSRSLWEGRIEPLEYSQIGSVIGTHAGPGAIAVAFFSSEPDCR